MSAGTQPRHSLAERALGLRRSEEPAGTAGSASGPSPAEASRQLAAVYAEHFRYVWRCLRSLGVRDAALDDALQDVFLVVQKRLPDFDDRAQVSTWLYAIALRVARRYRAASAKSSSREVAVESEPPASHRDLQTELEHSERLSLARSALDALDAEKREVFVLAQVEQLSAPEIASIVGIPLNTVYSRLRAARQAFAAEVHRLEARSRSAP